MIGEVNTSVTAQEKIRELNDAFRRTFQGGRVLITIGVQGLEPEEFLRLIDRVQTFSDFTEAIDPHGEHDFGAFVQDNRRYFWTIDYYDPHCEFGSENPADPTKTCRVLTVMLAEEY